MALKREDLQRGDRVVWVYRFGNTIKRRPGRVEDLTRNAAQVKVEGEPHSRPIRYNELELETPRRGRNWRPKLGDLLRGEAERLLSPPENGQAAGTEPAPVVIHQAAGEKPPPAPPPPAPPHVVVKAPQPNELDAFLELGKAMGPALQAERERLAQREAQLWQEMEELTDRKAHVEKMLAVLELVHGPARPAEPPREVPEQTRMPRDRVSPLNQAQRVMFWIKERNGAVFTGPEAADAHPDISRPTVMSLLLRMTEGGQLERERVGKLWQYKATGKFREVS